MLLYQFLSLDESLWLQTIVRMQLHGWLNPEFRFSLGMLHMYVRTRFLTREEVETKPLDAQDGRAHSHRIAQGALPLVVIPAVMIPKQVSRSCIAH